MFNTEEQKIIQRAKDLESDAKDLRKTAEVYRQARLKREEIARNSAKVNLREGVRILVEDIRKSQGLGDYKFNVADSTVSIGFRGDTATVTLTLTAR